MGLFGLAWTAFMLSGKAVNGIRDGLKNRANKVRSPDGIMYYDSKGRRRLVSNDHFCADEYRDGYRRIIDVTNNRIVWDARDSDIAKNLAEYYCDATAKGRTTYRCDTHRDRMPYAWGAGGIYGHTYKDFRSKRVYVIREIDGYSFYVDVATNRAVRYTDYELARMERADQECERKRHGCGQRQQELYPSCIDRFRTKHSGRDPLEEYNHRARDRLMKAYYHPGERGGYSRSKEALEEEFDNNGDIST